ncbi:MAG: amidase [Acidobacteriaceae bacterium]|jgi:Asp-tRNA(Asn)/Glu-tRNA(Gln) amidotransferase A subunit family amidase|nr:amidase [Acidobacteriaceae bacterium]
MNGLTVLPAVELLAMLRRKQISPLELADEYIQQIERLNPQLHALVDFDAERVRAQARALQDAAGNRGPLFGLPMTLKASIATAGYRCELGSLLHRGHVPRENATVVDRAMQAGAVILGTTNCPEFLMAYETDNRLYGRTANPWNTERTAGGSSGGEAAAIAAGLSAAGLGSDSGGSVREPAHFTGICSLKPTPGRIPSRGHLAAGDGPFSILGAIGPMARTVRDVTLLFITLSGQDERDPVSPPIGVRNESLEDLKRVPIGFFEEDGPVTVETRQVVRDAARALESQGFKVRPFKPQALEEARQLWWKFFVRGGAMLLDPLVKTRHAELSPTFLDFLSIAHREPPLSAEELLSAWMDLDYVRRKLLAEMESFPILLCPVCAIPAFRHGERSWDVDGRRLEYLDAMRYTQWFNLLGAPAAVVPVGRSPEGLPIGVQIAGRPFEDERVLGIAAAVEAGFGYKPPPLTVP